MTRILIADDLASQRDILRASLQGFDDEFYEADSGAAAIATLAQHRGPWVVLLDWVMPEPDGFAVCRLVREQFTECPPYVILISSKAGRVDIARGVRAGADEFLTKPIAPDVLRSRVRAALRRVSGDRPPSTLVLDGLREGAREGDGELIVRDAEIVWRVHFHQGRVSWVASTEDTESFTDALAASGLMADELKAAATEARRSGQGFFDILVDWGLVDQQRLREVALSWTQRRVHALMRPRCPTVLFVPWKRQLTHGGLSFALEELVAPETLAVSKAPRELSLLPLPGRSAVWTDAFFHVEHVEAANLARLEAAMQHPGAVCCAIFEKASGRCEGWRGEPPDAEIVWAHLQAFNAHGVAGDAVEDMVLSTTNCLHVMRTIEGEQANSLICYMVVERKESSLGMARSALATLCRRTPNPPSALRGG